MSSTNELDVNKMVGIYKKLFILLFAITALGILLSFVQLPIGITLMVAFSVMALKSKAVIDSFGFLLAGRNGLVVLFSLTVVFFAAVILLPFFNAKGQIVGTKDLSMQIQLEQGPPKQHHEENHGH